MIVKLISHNNAEQFSGKIQLSIDRESYQNKPAGAEVGAIRNRLSGRAAAHLIDIPTLAAEMNNGHTIQGATLRDKQNENEDTDSRFTGQQLFYIDIDNDEKNENGEKVKSSNAIETPEQIQAIAAAAGLTPCIIAPSFSNGKKDVNGATIPKYHVCFAAAEPVTDVKQARRIIENLMKVYGGQADKACKDPARILYGTRESEQVFYNSAVNSLETLLNCSPAEPEEPEPPQLPSSEPAPKAKRTQSTAPKASGKTGHNSEFTTDIKENKADPDILLQMIPPADIDYNTWLRVSAAYKLFESHSVEVWDSWNRQYTSPKANYKADLKAFKALTAKGINKMSLHAIAEQESPEQYNNYINALIQEHKSTAPRNNSKSNRTAAADPAGALPEGGQVNTQAEQVEQWADIKPFEKNTDLQPFPLETLPKVLRDYVEAVTAYNSVYPEMCILPLFSALSLCLQGKAVVKHPGTGFEQPINLYCITIAPPSERKTHTQQPFFKPINDYEKRYNTIHDRDIKDYHIKREMLQNKLRKTIQRAKDAKDEREALQLRADLTKLEAEPVNPLNFTVQDITPEALIDTLNENKERAAIIGDEATLFKILGGAYSSKGSSGVNFDILLNCYDGTQYRVSRKNSGNTYLQNPLATIGIMVQPQPFKDILESKDFKGKGLLQRFIFTFPRSNAGNVPFSAPEIPSKTAAAYKDLIYSLLEKPQPENPAALKFNAKAKTLIEYYHYELQKKLKTSKDYSDLETEYINKQISKALRIAALLHFCGHSETEMIDELTAMNAVKISTWLENQAAAALNEEMMTDTERNARYILKRITDQIQKAAIDQNKPLTKRDISRLCQTVKGEALQEALAYLDDMNVLRYQEEKQSRGRPTMKVYLNPAITDFKF